MFKRILVPLDGSSRAEQAIPLAARIARSAGGSIVLFQGVNVLDHVGLYTTGSAELLQTFRESECDRARNYLAHVSSSQDFTGLKISTEVYIGDVASSLLDAVQHQEADLIVLCSHGYTGLKRWALGSVARKIARHSPVPVLILREEYPLSLEHLSQRNAQALRVCVALDGSPFAEAIIAPTVRLVAALDPLHKGDVHLVRIVVPPNEEEVRRYESFQVDIRQIAYNEACTYLQSMQNRITKELGDIRVNISWAVDVYKDAAEALIQQATCTIGASRYDLLALATHGRGGMTRFILGSVAERILDHTRLPLFIVRPQQQSNHDHPGTSSIMLYGIALSS